MGSLPADAVAPADGHADDKSAHHDEEQPASSAQHHDGVRSPNQRGHTPPHASHHPKKGSRKKGDSSGGESRCDETCVPLGDVHYPSHWERVSGNSGHLCGFFKPHSHTFYVAREGGYRQWNSRLHRLGKSTARADHGHSYLHPDAEGLPESWVRNHMDAVLPDKKAKRDPWKQRSKWQSFARSHVRDLSWWTAILFLWGSFAWLLNGIFLFHKPFSSKDMNHAAAAYSAFAASIIFIAAGWSLLWETLNQDGHVGQEDEEQVASGAPTHKERRFVAALRKALHLPASQKEHRGSYPNEKWRWIGMDSFRDIGWCGTAFTLVGAIIYGISDIYAIPALYLLKAESSYQRVWDGLYWAPQIIGGALLVIAGLAVMLECQPSWWRLQPATLGWYIGFFNTIGSLAFMTAGIVGAVHRDEHARYWGEELGQYVGGIAYVLANSIQYVEVLL